MSLGRSKVSILHGPACATTKELLEKQSPNQCRGVKWRILSGLCRSPILLNTHCLSFLRMAGIPLVSISPGLHVSKLCLGTMTFGEQNTYAEACEQLNEATEAGVNFIDSAEMYPVPQQAITQGRSEEYIGRWLKQSSIPRHHIVLATKVSGPSAQMPWIRGGPHSLDQGNIITAIDDSLKRLNTDYIDLYQIHWPDRYVPMFGETDYQPTHSYTSIPIEEQLTALQKAKDAGKILHVGVSNETAYGVMEFCRIAAASGVPRIVTTQNAYSLLCRTFDMTLAECCHLERVSLLAYSPLAMGLLSGKYLAPDGGPPQSRLNVYRGRYAEAEGRYGFTKPNLRPAVSAYVDLARKHGISPVALAIGFVLRRPLVGSVVIGATQLWQLREILGSVSVSISPEILAAVEAVHERYPNPTP